MTDNSDYTKPRINLFDRLPEVNRSDTNKALFENLFNRYLTKQETKKIVGYIGEGNPDAIVRRQIQENTIHRQGYQLQPILYNKIGSVEWMSSWYDILNKAERLGIDKERMQDWLDLLQFNWAPPIDLDKLIHYRDYFWVDEDDPTSRPQYITIRSRCAVATALVNFIQTLVDQFGETIATTEARSVDAALPEFPIVSITATQVVVTGNATNDFADGNFFDIEDSSFNDGKYQIEGTLSYDIVTDQTTIPITLGSPVASPSPVTEETALSPITSVGTLVARRFDKLVVAGDYITLFDPGLVFFYKNSTNDELNLSFLEVDSSEYDEVENETIIKLTTVFTDDTVDGLISQEERLDAAVANRDCLCTGGVGWDVLQWDDNPDDPLWDGDHGTFVDSISETTAPIDGVGVNGQLWWNTTTDKLYKYDDANEVWKLLYNNFQLILNDTAGQAFWDFTPGCGMDSVTTTADQWIDQNKWLHKSDVTNFSRAKRAQLPIIEYDWDLELNEWTQTTYDWKYRTLSGQTFVSVDAEPERIELTPLSRWELDGEEIVLHESYGDLTDYFAEGRQFTATNILTLLTVEYSYFAADAVGQPFRTRIKLTDTIASTGLIPSTGSPIVASTTQFIPIITSQGDSWKGYGTHWLFGGAIDTVPVPHQPVNPLIEIPTLQGVAGSPITGIPPSSFPTVHSSGDYTFTYTYYSLEASILNDDVTDIEFIGTLLPGTDLSLRERALLGTANVRVYVNEIRQYGTYTELDADGNGYVTGISFLPTFELEQFDLVRIEVGEASSLDFGLASLSIRTIENDATYLTEGNETVSLVRYHKEEQVKTDTNQYPLFDMYRVDGTPAFMATPLFSFVTDSDADVNSLIGLRLATDFDSQDYIFQQHLVEEDGTMYAYRDYANQTNDFWYDPEDEIVWFWDGLAWSRKTEFGVAYGPAIVSDTEPMEPWNGIEGTYWYDTVNDQLLRLSLGSPEQTSLTFTTANEDPTLQTIWKAGLNKETYTPEKRDWLQRSQSEYDAERDTFVEERAEELVATEGLTETEATAQATTEWLVKQSNPLSETGVWIGDWEIPDPLYHNVHHENRQQVTFREILTHFDTIIEAQPKIPGYQGDKDTMFHLIPSNEVNYCCGGTIKEFNSSFDIFLSSLFTNMVTPLELYNFAHDQYEVLINNLRDLIRRDATDYFTDVTDDSIANFSNFLSEQIIAQHEQNDYYNVLYGDSTTFTDIPGTGDIGIRNWIATLPYLELVRAQIPVALEDDVLGINEVVHHDTHRTNYAFTAAVIEGIIRGVIETEDPRTVPAGGGDPLDTFGRLSTSLPPDTVSEFESSFSTPINDRRGVYWYYTPTRTLYRLNLIAIGPNQPADTYADGVLWLDLKSNNEVLRIKTTDPNTSAIVWEIVEGLEIGSPDSFIKLHNGTNVTDATVSAWQIVDLDVLLRDTVIAVENLLFENAPDPAELAYDFDALRDEFTTEYDALLEAQFSAYLTEQEISTPFVNDEYEQTDPFTWNYKNSTPGQTFDIIDVDEVNNAFILDGDLSFGFPINTVFYIKNSGSNDGLWKTDSVIGAEAFGSPATKTRVYTNGDRTVSTDTPFGDLYRGLLPSPINPDVFPFNLNDGSESGGYWKDLYNKFYNTPYPHLEPWKLQGYTSKPTWWDEEYLNDDTDKWGDRRWKYKHGFDIIALSNANETFTIEGDFREVFLPAFRFNVDRSLATPNNDGVWQMRSLYPITDVTVASAGSASIAIAGDHTNEFVIGLQIAVTNSSNALTQLLSITGSSYDGAETTINVEEAITTSTGFTNISGAVYDSLTNLTTIYIDTTVVNANTNILGSSPIDGRIAYAYGMWENIRRGRIPAGRDYPNGVTSITGTPSTDMAVHGLAINPLPKFNYFSVNIDNVAIQSSGFLAGSTFQPDDLLPPYWDYVAWFGAAVIPAFDRPIRSIFYLFNQIVSPGLDYVFGDSGPIEYDWRVSSQFLYDQMTVAFKLDPVEFVFKTFGPDFYEIGCLLIDKTTEQVLSHTNTTFHGDLVDDEVVKYNGTNQWYINFARYASYDISMSDFRPMWINWTTPMTYQFASFIDTPSFEIGHRQVCISEFDYNITAKRSPGVEDYWLDSFEITFLNIPPKTARSFANDNQWALELRTRSTPGTAVKYYDVRNYQFYADPNTDICTLYTWENKDTNVINDTFTVGGDQTFIFSVGREFDVTNSTGNDGTYTTKSAAYNRVTNETVIEVDQDISDNTDDGLITANYRSLIWETGDVVVLSTHGILPFPLEGDNVNGTFQYFVIPLTSNTFQLARTRGDAESGTNIDITSKGMGNHYIGQLSGTFGSQKSNNIWKHYVVDKTNELQFTPPQDIQGIQNLVNIINGYREYTEDQGWRINSDSTLKDFDRSSRLVSWQLELERFIDFAIGLRQQRNILGEQFQATVSVATNQWTFVGDNNPQFITGDSVVVQPSGNLFPTPLARGIRYYMIRDSLTNFRLAATLADAKNGIGIDITSISGVDDLFIVAAKNLRRERPKTEINPFRNAIWFRPSRGIVSNVLQGPLESVFDTQLMVDQYGRALGSDLIRVFREDKETAIRIEDGIPNDIGLSSVFPSPYNYLHLSAAHLFVDTYEHVLIFNNRTTEDLLLYDPFIGLNVTKFELLFNRQLEFTERPNVGGQFLLTRNNQGADLIRNWEASVEDMRDLYDTYRVIEANDLIKAGRTSIGYDGRKDYLDLMNINAKSQFVFWKGQIQAKGSINSINAFINSKRFIDAEVDEFWAVKIADFGSVGEKEYISMLLSTRDTRANVLYLHFISDLEGDTDTADTGFSGISLTDDDRWFDQPIQLAKLRDNGGTLYFDLKPIAQVPVTISNTTPGVGSPNTTLIDNEGWIDTSNAPAYTFYRWNSSKIVTGSPFDAGEFEDHGTWDTTLSPSELPILRHGMTADYISITLDWYPAGKITSHTVAPGSPTVITIDPYIHSADSIRVFKDGVQLDSDGGYTEIFTDGDLLATQIMLTDAIVGSPSTIEIVYKTSTLVEGIHFTKLTSDIVELNYNELITGSSPSVTPTNMVMWGWLYDDASQNPAKIIDTESQVVVTPVEHWDPARGFHYSTAEHIIDLQRDKDPAIYTETLLTEQAPDPIYDFELIYNDPWNDTEIGTTWLDTSLLKYQPYYDPAVTTAVDQRARLWGQLADWAEVKLYTWVESEHAPDDYDAVAEQEEGDASIPANERNTGRVRKTLFKPDGSGWARAVNIIDEFDVAIEGQISGGDTTFTLENIQPVTETISAVSFAENLTSYIVTFSGHYGRRLEEGTEALIAGANFTIDSDISADDDALTTTATVSGDTILGSAQLTTADDVDANLDGTYFTLDVPNETYPETDDYYVWYNTPARPEITNVGFIGSPAGDVDGSLGGTYFTLNAPTQAYYIWFNVTPRTEITELDFTNVSGATLAQSTGSPLGSPLTTGEHFDISSTTADYRFWFDGPGSQAPADGGRTLVAVTFTAADTDQVVSNSVVTALQGADTDFAGAGNASGTTPLITMELATVGAVTPPSAAGFIGSPLPLITVTQKGISASVDPGTAGSPIPAGVGQQIDIDGDDTADLIATEIQTVLDTLGTFSALLLTSTIVQITNTDDGAVVDATSGTSGIDVNVTQQGTDTESDPEVANRTGIQVDITVDATDIAVATATRNALTNANIENLTIAAAGSPANIVTVTADLAAPSFDATLGTIPTSPGFGLIVTNGFAPSVDDNITFYEPVNVYVNGKENQLRAGVPITGNFVVSDLNEVDRVTIIQPPVPIFDTDEERQAYIDAEVEVGNLTEQVEHTVDTIFDNLGLEQTRYYFWVENKTTRSGRVIPPSEAAEQLAVIPVPFMFFQNVEESLDTSFGDMDVTLPVRFTQAVVSGIRGLVNDDDRYVIRWTRDFTLRDTLDAGDTPLEKKNLHEEWQLIRRKQTATIPRWLWNKVTECMVGYKLDDMNERVPSLERELYDTENGTSTRIGIGDGQAFANGDLVKATILADLNNDANEFNVDINTFFENNNFDTPEDIITAMNTIYTTFAAEHVNRMFFDALLDGLSDQPKYVDLFKTSMVALVGVRPFQVGGLFDD